MSDPPRPPSQPPVFWYALAATAVLLVVLVLTLVVTPNAPFAVGILIGLGIAAVVGAGFALSLWGRQRRTREAFPDGIHMPIVVGPALAAATAQLSEARSMPGLRLAPSTYATIAVDRRGLCLVAGVVRADRMIEASSVTVSGLGSTMSGARLLGCLLVEVRTGDGSITLPVIPIRLRNIFRTFSADDLGAIADNLRRALTGETYTPGWPY